MTRLIDINKMFFDTFDILNCVQPFRITRPVSSLIWRGIGHTAVIYRHPTTNIPYVLESTTRNKNGKSGIQLTPLTDWLNETTHEVYLRRAFMLGGYTPFREAREAAEAWLDEAADVLSKLFEHFREAREAAEAWLAKYKDTPYPNLKSRWGRFFLLKSTLDFGNPLVKELFTNPDIDWTMFCTMAVAHFYRFCGLWNGNPAEMEPDDCRDGGKFEKGLRDDCYLMSEVRIK